MRQNQGLFLNRFRRLKHRHFEIAYWKETRPLRKVASGARHREANNESVDDTQHQGLNASVYTQVYTGVENSGLLGPVRRSGLNLKPLSKICPALST